jgi:NADPH-dependent curcumin reductase CurA
MRQVRSRQSYSKPLDLDEELFNREVEVVVENHGTLRGRVLASSNYWLKLEVNKKQIYINKPFIIYIKTLENGGSHTIG